MVQAGGAVVQKAEERAQNAKGVRPWFAATALASLRRRGSCGANHALRIGAGGPFRRSEPKGLDAAANNGLTRSQAA